jgi:hypothetical protein
MPAGHEDINVILVLLYMQYLPAGHSRHGPPVKEYLPSPHDVQLPAFAAENVPAAHGVHDVAPAAEYVPAAHGVHDVAPAAEYVPAAHDSIELMV